ncbi:ankyrin repeat domain-containing protein 31 isoform X3 [Anser cygnoides]|uniref:ankyrin repeat domain-containing protein 31 isoform X3 n=1 Tax=Anser cygnoides TaxID=8845 RepID=UPI0034D33788
MPGPAPYKMAATAEETAGGGWERGGANTPQGDRGATGEEGEVGSGVAAPWGSRCGTATATRPWWRALWRRAMWRKRSSTGGDGVSSPEIHFMHIAHDHMYGLKVKQIPQERYAPDQSQSLLQSWINYPLLTENISKPAFSLNSAVEGQQNNSLDTKVIGFQRDSEGKISQKISYEGLSPVTSQHPDAFLEKIIAVPKQQTPQDLFPHVLEDCQRTCMTVIDTDNSVKEQSCNNDTDLSLATLGNIFTEPLVLTEQSIETAELEVSDLLRPLSDSESPKTINQLHDVLDYQGHVFSSDISADENSDALPVELVTALNSLSGSVIQSDSPVVPSKRQHTTEEEQLNSESSTPQQDDDCTQITNVFEPQLPTIHEEEIKALTGSNLQRTTNEQPAGDQQKGKEAISDYWSAISNEKQNEEGSLHSVEAVVCAETNKTASGRTMQLEETSSIKCRDSISCHHQALEETQQSMSHNHSTTRNKTKDFSKILKPASKDKEDLETNMYQEITPNEDRNAEQIRRSKRIKDKMRLEAYFVNPCCPISLSRINRRNIFGETLLHRAVAEEDIDLVRNIIKSGANVNAQDYAGWTALHEASVQGRYRIANELLKAGADVNARGSEQITPLQDAVKGGHYEVAALLLWYGADPLLKNEWGRCALEEASDQSMKRLLKSYLVKSRRDSVSGGDDAENTLSAQSVDDTNLHQISLQTGESVPACANLTGTGSADILQQTTVNEVQNIHINILDDGTSCIEQTPQTNTEAILARELSAATSGESVSRSLSNSTGGALSTIEEKAPQPEKGWRILLNAEQSAEGCHTEATENASSIEIQFTALQLHEKEAHQIKHKRQDLQETNSKSDEGGFAGMNGIEGTEENEEGSGKSNVFSQFTEAEEIQTKRMRLDLQETSQKRDLCSSSSKYKLSSNQSQFNQASEQQTSKKSGGSKKRKRNAKGETKLHIAARRGNLSLVKTLISSGICVNEQDNAGWTAIHEASNGGCTEVILELLKAGANVNSRSMNGVLPIHDAVSGNYLEAARILLEHGANPCERDSSGKSALDEACDDEMKELLKSYGAIDSVLPVETIEVTERSYLRSRRAKICFECCKNDDAALKPQCEKSCVESVVAIQDTKKKQKELLLCELRTSKDADMYVQRLCQIQNTLNEMFAKQKTERDALAKKYRASVESFKKGALREQVFNLASRQKSLLTVAQNQKELVQKIQNYRKTKQVFRAAQLEDQISNILFSYGNGKGQGLAADEIMHPDVVTSDMGLGASMANGNRVEAHLSLENRFSAQECSQHPNNCLAETEANKEAIRSKEVSDHTSTSEKTKRKYPFNTMSNAVEVVTVPSETAGSTAETKNSQQNGIDCVAVAEQGHKSLHPTPATNTLNISEARSTVVNNNVCQPGGDCQQVLTDEDLHRYVNKKEAFQQQHQQVIVSTSTENFSNTLQGMIFQCSENPFNANLVLTNLTSNTDYPANLSKKSSQGYSYQECGQKQVKYKRKNKKKLQLIDLLQLGRIKPGENVLEFKLQEFSHKATLLENGKIKTSENKILQNPVQWVKDLLGNDISVTWKYVWNKVTYRGKELSKLLVEEVPVSNDLELPSQQRESLGKNFITRDPSNHTQHYPSPCADSVLPVGSFDLSNMHPRTQTETAKTLLCTEREAAESLPITRELRRPTFHKVGTNLLRKTVQCLNHHTITAREKPLEVVLRLHIKSTE